MNTQVDKMSQDKMRKEGLALRAYATEQLSDAFPNVKIDIEMAYVGTLGNRILSVYIDDRLFYERGWSNAKVVNSIIEDYKAAQAREKSKIEKIALKLNNQKNE